MLNPLAVIGGALLVLTVLWEAFETIVLPRRVTRTFRLTRAFYRITWKSYAGVASLRKNRKKRDAMLSFYLDRLNSVGCLLARMRSST